MDRLVLTCDGSLALADELEAAFAKARAAAVPTAVLILPEASKLSREIVGPIVRGVASCRSLVDLVLVHPNALLGFIASSIALQAPNARIRSVTTLDALED